MPIQAVENRRLYRQIADQIAALVESGAEPDDPATKASPSGDGWVVDGTKICVPGGLDASHALISARPDDGAARFVVALSAPGVGPPRLPPPRDRPEPRLPRGGPGAMSNGGAGASASSREKYAWPPGAIAGEKFTVPAVKLALMFVNFTPGPS